MLFIVTVALALVFHVFARWLMHLGVLSLE